MSNHALSRPRAVRAILRPISALVALAIPTPTVSAQTTETIGGIPCRVHRPLAPPQGPWPTVLLLHGFDAAAANYDPLASALARAGWRVVAPLNRGPMGDYEIQSVRQRETARAIKQALGDTLGRPALAGHSMGGGNVCNVLAGRTGRTGAADWSCGLAWAPAARLQSRTRRSDSPLAVFHVETDSVVPSSTGRANYHAAEGATRFFVELRGSGQGGIYDHGALVSIPASAAFQRTLAGSLGFLKSWMSPADTSGMAALMDSTATSGTARVLSTAAQLTTWATDSSVRIGSRLELWNHAEPGPTGLLTGTRLADSPPALPFGKLLLAAPYVALPEFSVSSMKTAKQSYVIPHDPALVGAHLWFQGLGVTSAGLFLGRNPVRIEFIQP